MEGTAKELRWAKPGQRRWSEIPPGQVCAGNPGDLLGSFQQKLEIASKHISRARCMLHHTPQKETISRTLQFCKHICGRCEGWYCSLIQLIGYIKVNVGRELHTFAIGIVSRPWQIRIRRAQALQLLGQDLGRKAGESWWSQTVPRRDFPNGSCFRQSHGTRCRQGWCSLTWSTNFSVVPRFHDTFSELSGLSHEMSNNKTFRSAGAADGTAKAVLQEAISQSVVCSYLLQHTQRSAVSIAGLEEV